MARSFSSSAPLSETVAIERLFMRQSPSWRRPGTIARCADRSARAARCRRAGSGRVRARCRNRISRARERAFCSIIRIVTPAAAQLLQHGEDLLHHDRRQPDRRLVDQHELADRAAARARSRAASARRRESVEACCVAFLPQHRESVDAPPRSAPADRRCRAPRRRRRARCCRGPTARERCCGPAARSRCLHASSSRGARSVTSRPSNTTLPSRSFNRPKIALNTVDLPAPFGADHGGDRAAPARRSVVPFRIVILP